MKTIPIVLRVLLVGALTSGVHAQAPRTISYQGVLQADGGPVTAATDMTFRLFDVPEGGSALWTEAQTVAPSEDGTFEAALGSATALDLSFGLPLWLEVDVAGVVLAPRTPLQSVPYALGLYGLRVQPYERSPDLPPGGFSGAPNLIGGWHGNEVIGNGSTIGGGGTEEEPNRIDGYDSVIGGGSGNLIGGSSGALIETLKATIGGGARNTISSDYGTIGGGVSNTVAGDRATIGGGLGNVASGDFSTVGGGRENEAAGHGGVGAGLYNDAGPGAWVGGGRNNDASGLYAVIPGGLGNVASEGYSFAAGYLAEAEHEGTFVWSSYEPGVNGTPFRSTGPSQFLIRAVGGVGINSPFPAASLDVHANSTLDRPHLMLWEDQDGDYARLRFKNTSNAEYWDLAGGAGDSQFNVYSSVRGDILTLWATGAPLRTLTGAYLSEGGAWTNASSVHLKDDFEAVDPEAVLAALAALPVQEWQYTAEAGVRHLGPTAQDFAAAFGLGGSDEAIATVDADGVALAAIQALLQRVERQEAEIAELRALVERCLGPTPERR